MEESSGQTGRGNVPLERLLVTQMSQFLQGMGGAAVNIPNLPLEQLSGTNLSLSHLIRGMNLCNEEEKIQALAATLGKFYVEVDGLLENSTK